MAGRKRDESLTDHEYRSAVTRGRSNRVRAETVAYNADTGRIDVELRNGALFGFPPPLVMGLSDAAPEALADVEIYGAGTALHWRQLDVDYELSALMAGVFWTRAWMRELGRRGGSRTSEAKAKAARENGRKGGRPRRGR